MISALHRTSTDSIYCSVLDTNEPHVRCPSHELVLFPRLLLGSPPTPNPTLQRGSLLRPRLSQLPLTLPHTPAHAPDPAPSSSRETTELPGLTLSQPHTLQHTQGHYNICML